MKLNPDCIRDILLTVEENTDHQRRMVYHKGDKFPLLNSYCSNEVVYHIQQCDYAGYFIGFQKYIGGAYRINDLSPKAHEFLANIRSDENWAETKVIAEKSGSLSIPILQSVASSLIVKAIETTMGM